MQPFVILMPWGRVGSNLVLRVLSDHGGITIANEPTTAIRSRYRQHGSAFDADCAQLAYLRAFPDIAEAAATPAPPPVGMKLSHRSFVSPMLVYSILAERGFRLVTMDRRNHIKAAISQIRADQRKQAGDGRQAWALRQGQERPGPSQINPVAVINRARAFAQNATLMQQYVQHFFPGGRLDIHYEDLNADPVPAIGRIAGFLDVSLPTSFTLPHAKATADDLSLAVENWDEVREALAATEFASLLEG